ncbi:hypothetical protein [Nostoc sp.]|uniref:hypothetical protein n=1 Tax=Nostoc sp. TaxID=1180 RepID=UPI002FF96064
MPSLLLSETLREREACLRHATRSLLLRRSTPTATSSLRDATRSLLPRSRSVP